MRLPHSCVRIASNFLLFKGFSRRVKSCRTKYRSTGWSCLTTQSMSDQNRSPLQTIPCLMVSPTFTHNLLVNNGDCCATGQLESPMTAYLGDLIPPESQTAKFQMILPKKWPNPKIKPVVIHLAGTGDHVCISLLNDYSSDQCLPTCSSSDADVY